MPKYRHALPQLQGGLFLTDGGMETTLIFDAGFELPHFAAFVLMDDPRGRAALEAYYRRYLAIARDKRLGFVLDTPTWRANADWGARIGYDAAGLDRINRASAALAETLRANWPSTEPCVISGAIGPRGDGYQPGANDVDAARGYHAAQVESFAASEADMVGAYTLTTVAEAAGIALSARDHGMPCMISFTVETDGRLVTGRSLGEAIEAVDDKTGGYPAYYMVNCAHPLHFAPALERGEAWLARLGGVRANASTRSHAELDASDTLDSGDPQDLGRRYRRLTRDIPSLRVLGGCCGTDHRHVAAICEACSAPVSRVA